MLIKEMFQTGKTLVSFEIFPPKKDDDIQKLYNTVENLKEINPDFVSVTYGAGGSTRDKTVEIASFIKNNLGLETMAHLTCVNSTREEIITVLNKLKNNNINNILALRGDPPQGEENFTKTIGGFGFAYELVDFIKNNNQNLSICVAGYPEGHFETPDIKKSIEYLKLKVDKGADFIISQLYFNNSDFFKFKELAQKIGINIPIIPGIFPILNFKAIQKITSLCGAKIPPKLYEKLEKSQDNLSDIEKIGIEYAIKQADELLDYQIDGIHFYTMNKSAQIKEIYNAVKSKIKRIKK